MTHARWKALVLAAGVILGTPASGAGTSEVVIDVSGQASGQGVSRPQLIRLLSWKAGALCDAAILGLSVSAIVEGALDDPGYPSRPVGTNHLDVLVIDAALWAYRTAGSAHGRWTLKRLPDGTYLVEDPAKTPFANASIEPKREALRKAIADLSSGDPKRQARAFDGLEENQCLSLAPVLMTLLESKGAVTVVQQGPNSGRRFKREVRISELASNVLGDLTLRLRDRKTVRMEASRATWEAWWKGLLRVEPFPRVSVSPGEPEILARLDMNQTHPEFGLDPAGRFAVVAVSGMQQPLAGATAGIRLIQSGSPKPDDFVLKIPPEERGRVPTDLAVAWNGGVAGMVWQEYEYEGPKRKLRFMALDTAAPKAAPKDLRLPKTQHYTLGALGSGRWLLAGTLEPKDPDGEGGGALFALELDSTGRVLRSLVPMPVPVVGEPGTAMDPPKVGAVLGTPRGPALVVIDNFKLVLSLLDPALKPRKAVQVNDPAEQGNGFSPGLTSDGKTLCVAWVEPDNHGSRLFARLIDLDGRPLTPARPIADEVGAMAGPVAFPGGYLVAWVDDSQTPFQVRLASLKSTAEPAWIKVVHQGQDWIGALGLGFREGAARVMAYDTARYPHLLWLKAVEIR